METFKLIISSLGIALFCLSFGWFGYNHFKNLNTISEYADSNKIPFPRFSVIATGALFFVVVLSILFRHFIKIPYLIDGSLVSLSLFLIASAILVHGDNQTDAFKNFALAGATLLLTGVF